MIMLIVVSRYYSTAYIHCIHGENAYAVTSAFSGGIVLCLSQDHTLLYPQIIICLYCCTRLGQVCDLIHILNNEFQYTVLIRILEWIIIVVLQVKDCQLCTITIVI